jgi:hypothetical protein
MSDFRMCDELKLIYADQIADQGLRIKHSLN